MEAIYYPNVYVESLTWLKFAMLYFRHIYPITPSGLPDDCPDWYAMTIEETDLIRPHFPTYQEGAYATTKVIERVDMILARPKSYWYYFRTPSLLEKWRAPENQTELIYHDKYTDEWATFCVKHGFAKPTERGILLSPDLASIYMTVLADTISSFNEMSLVTDSALMHNFSQFAGRPPQTKTLSVGASIIELALPNKMGLIPIERIIDFRNRKDYQDCLYAFHRELDKFLAVNPQGTPNEFLDEYERSRGQLFTSILNLTGSVTPVVMSAASIVHGHFSVASAIGEAASAASALAAVNSIATARRSNTSARQCKRYLASLRRNHWMAGNVKRDFGNKL